MLLNILSNEQLLQNEAAEKAAIDEALLSQQPPLVGIAAHIMRCWESARTAKAPILERLLKSQRARRGEYDPNKLAAIRQVGGSEEYGRITGNKCRVAEAWLRDVYLGQAERAWTLRPSPVPDLPADEKARIRSIVQNEILEAIAAFNTAPPQDIIQSRINELEDAVRMRIREQATIAVERMEKLMADQLLHAGFNQEWADFLNDFVTYPAAHIKGPIFRRRKELKWAQINGVWTPKEEEVVVPVFERLDPARCYPAPNAITPQEAYFITHITLERSELYDLIGLTGFSEKEIRDVLDECDTGSIVNWLGFTDVTQMNTERPNFTTSPVSTIDCLEFYGAIPGKLLLDWGMSPEEIDDPDKDYECCAWLIGRHVIKAQLNPHPLGERPIHKACWEEIPSEYWGRSLPDSLEDVQGVVNAAIRALVNNMAIASGPQVTINVDRLPPGMSVQSLAPWQIWQVRDSQFGSTAPAIEFHQPATNAAEIISVLETFYRYADDWSLIPRYMQGSDNLAGSVGRTASGLSMLFNAANKGLKGVVSTIDHKVLTPMLSQLYTFNMLFHEDNTVKGDAQIEARGAVSLMQIETLQLRRNEFLQATANPIDSQIVGPDGRAEILREVAKGLEMDINRVVPRRGAVPMVQPPSAGTQQARQPVQEQLQNGAAVTDVFSPNTMRSPM